MTFHKREKVEKSGEKDFLLSFGEDILIEVVMIRMVEIEVLNF
jgi:hypothetical protein